MEGIYIVWIVVLVSTLTYTGASPIGECPISPTDYPVYLRDSTDCSVYYVCRSGRPVKYICPVGLLFNPIRNSCDYPEVVDCNLPIDPPNCDGCSKAECPQINDANVTFFPHDTDCTKYCMCDWGKVYEKPCPAGLHWNTNVNACDWPASAGCNLLDDGANSNNGECSSTTNDTPAENETTEKTAETPTESDGCVDAICLPSTAMATFAHKNACDKYCICNFGITTEGLCPHGLHFNRALSICDYPKNAQCNEDGISDTTTQIPSEPPTIFDGCSHASCSAANGTVFYPHASDCVKYCMCDAGVIVLMTCPDGLHFNRELSTCDYPKNAGCSDIITDGCSYASCSAANGTVFYSHASDCDKYCICNMGVIAEISCRDGLHYNRELNMCDYPKNAGCTDIITDITTTDPPTNYDGCSYAVCASSNGTVFYPHERDCALYCLCILGVTIEVTCPGDLLFNNELSTCVSAENSSCNQEGIEETTTVLTTIPTTIATTLPPSLGGCIYAICPVVNDPVFFPHNDECNKYCICNYGVTLEMSCPDGYHFDTESNSCDQPNEAGCENNSETTTAQSTNPPEEFEGCSSVVCPEVNDDNVTFYPHDIDCGKYCVCNWGRVIEMPCPADLHFNAKLNVCQFPTDAGCDTIEITTNEITTENTEEAESTTTTDKEDEEDEETTDDTESTEGGENGSTTSTTEKILPTTESENSVIGCDSTLCPPFNDMYVTFLAHKTDCGKYCVCDWGRAIEMSCPVGLLFNTQINVCDHPIFVHCGL